MVNFNLVNNINVFCFPSRLFYANNLCLSVISKTGVSVIFHLHLQKDSRHLLLCVKQIALENDALFASMSVTLWSINWLKAIWSQIQVPAKEKTLGDFFLCVQALEDRLTLYLSQWEVAGIPQNQLRSSMDTTVIKEYFSFIYSILHWCKNQVMDQFSVLQ